LDLKKLIDDLIPLPGYFMVFDKMGSVETKTKPLTGNYLNIFKDKEKAERVFAVYEKSHKNAKQLLVEAKILADNKYHARAVALAILSFEELGKSQIAADYYSGLLPEDEYHRAFKSHRKTSFAGRHRTIGSHHTNVKYGFWIDDSIAKRLQTIRQAALYVDENNNPEDSFTAEDAKSIIQKVRDHIEYIEYAEAFNGRIGSKALFK